MSESSFAELLRKVREKAGLSQYALAKKSGLTKQAISHLELGVREPTWQTVQLLCQTLGVDCREFVDPSVRAPGSEPIRSQGRPRKSSEPAPEDKPAASKPVPKTKRGKK